MKLTFEFALLHHELRASQVAPVVKNPPANEGGIGLIPGSGRFPGGGHGSPLQYSCLENPMDRGAWRATVHRGSEPDTTECLGTNARPTSRRGALPRGPGVKAPSLTHSLALSAGHAGPFEILPLPSFPTEVLTTFHPWHILQPQHFY